MGPLGSLRILDFTTLLPGPFASMILADLGAEVLRVESPTRIDLARVTPPLDKGGESVIHRHLNRSKRSLSLDLKQASARELIKRLVKAVLTRRVPLEFAANAFQYNWRPSGPVRVGARLMFW